MINIEQIRTWPLGYKSGGFVVTVKTAKKIWEVREIFYQQTAIMDETGEILADFRLGEKRIPLHSGGEYRIITCQVQYEEKHGKKLFVDQFQAITQTMNEFEAGMNFIAGENERVVRSKIKCWLVAATIQSGKDVIQARIDGYVDYIMK